MSRVVLDASALLAYLQGERGAVVVEMALQGAIVSAVNLAEAVTKLSETKSLSPITVRRDVNSLPIEVAAFDEEQAFQAGFMWRLATEHGLSLGDRSCIGLAKRLGAPVLTADRIWQRLPLGVEVKLIRS